MEKHNKCKHLKSWQLSISIRNASIGQLDPCWKTKQIEKEENGAAWDWRAGSLEIFQTNATQGRGGEGRIKRTGSESHFNRPHTIWAPTELSLPDRFLFIPYQCLPTASFLSFTLWGSSLTISQQLTPWNSLKGKRKGSKLNQSCLNNTTEEINS